MNELPHVTVATVVCHQEKFLLVEERDGERLVYNQPAGHVECGETVVAAAQRETLEETGWQVTLESYLGTYQHFAKQNGIYYVRHCFVAKPEKQVSDSPLDKTIETAIWLSRDEIVGLQDSLRSPMVLRAIEDYCHGPHYPLSVFKP